MRDSGSFIATLLAIYFVVWAVCLFVVLPIGITSQEESGEVTEGTDPGAPAKPQLLRKVVITSLLAVPASALLYAFIAIWT